MLRLRRSSPQTTRAEVPKEKNKIRRQRAWKLSKQVARLVAGSRLNQGQTMVRPSDAYEKRHQQQKWSAPLLVTRSQEQVQSSWKRRMSPTLTSTPSACGSQSMETKISAWNASVPSGQPRIY